MIGCGDGPQRLRVADVGEELTTGAEEEPERVLDRQRMRDPIPAGPDDEAACRGRLEDDDGESVNSGWAALSNHFRTSERVLRPRRDSSTRGPALGRWPLPAIARSAEVDPADWPAAPAGKNRPEGGYRQEPVIHREQSSDVSSSVP